jgi:hypothetical protein
MSRSDATETDDQPLREQRTIKARRHTVANVADATWTMLADAGVKRCYGIIGDALNPIIDALRRSG